MPFYIRKIVQILSPNLYKFFPKISTIKYNDINLKLHITLVTHKFIKNTMLEALL